jgi:rhamnose utilization protein RhaD (predicted bifunctional aldolase and dehydrogenase)
MSRAVIADLSDEAHAAGRDEPELLRHRSSLLGSDLSGAKFRGVDTSAQVETADPLTGETVKVLWVEGFVATPARYVAEVDADAAVSFTR